MKVKFKDILTLAVATMLLVAATTNQQYNYYVFVRWTVFLLSIYIAYKARHRAVFAVVLVSAVGILFNPILPFTFKKEIWHIIDFVIGIFIILTIDWKSYIEELSPKSKLVFNLVKSCLLGTLALIFAIWFWYQMIGNPYHEFLLITKATTVNGFITHSEEEEDDVESETQGSSRSFIVYYDFTFTTKKGEIIKDHASDRSPESGYLQEANENPLPIEVEYISSNPQIHRIKNMTGQANTIIDFLWRRIGLGTFLLLMSCAIGFEIIKNAIKKYLTEKNKITANIETQ